MPETPQHTALNLIRGLIPEGFELDDPHTHDAAILDQIHQVLYGKHASGQCPGECEPLPSSPSVWAVNDGFSRGAGVGGGGGGSASVSIQGGWGGSGAVGRVGRTVVGSGGGGNNASIPRCPVCSAFGGGGHGGGCPNSGLPPAQWVKR